MSRWDDNERDDDGRDGDELDGEDPDSDHDPGGWDGNDRDGDDIGRAPICPSCGVTALPAELSNVIDSGFVCENPDCEAFGEPIDS